MTAYILRRLVMLVPVLIVVGVVVFALVHLTPGDPAAVILGDRATPEDIARLREQLGLNDPLPVQFPRWFGDVLRLDFGESIFLGEPVTQALLDRVQPTVLLTLYALSIQVLIGIPAGVLAAVRHNSPLDRVLTVMAISGSAIPTFFLGILLILIFAVRLRWLPSGGYVPFGEDPAAHFKAMLLPAFALGFSAAGLLARLVRSSMLDVLREDYVRTAFAKGLPEQSRDRPPRAAQRAHPGPDRHRHLDRGAARRRRRHRDGLHHPGHGRLVVQSIARRDYPVIQGAIIAIAMTYVLVNLVVDVLYVYIDPRVRLGGE